MVQKFRKKPVVVEACREWIGGRPEGANFVPIQIHDTKYYDKETQSIKAI